MTSKKRATEKPTLEKPHNKGGAREGAELGAGGPGVRGDGLGAARSAVPPRGIKRLVGRPADR